MNGWAIRQDFTESEETVSVQEEPSGQWVPAAQDGDGGVRTLLVVGNSRSGTTMFAKMLGRHSQIHDVRELHFSEELWLPSDEASLPTEEAVAVAERLLHNAREWYHTPYRPGPLRQDAEAVVASLDVPAMATDVLAAVLALEARVNGKSVAVEQTPTNVFYVEQLLDRLPGSMAVVLTRDPRDVLLSQKNWWRRRFRGTADVPWATTARQWADYHPVVTSLVWRGGIRAGLRAAARSDVIHLRFEDLVARPEDVLDQVLGPMGLQVEPGMIDVPRISSSNAADRGGAGVDPSVVGQFRQGLTGSETWVSQRLTRPEMALLGHVPVPVRPSPLGLVGLALLLPVKLALALLLNRRRTRNLLTSVRRRLRP